MESPEQANLGVMLEYTLEELRGDAQLTDAELEVWETIVTTLRDGCTDVREIAGKVLAKHGPEAPMEDVLGMLLDRIALEEEHRPGRA